MIEARPSRRQCGYRSASMPATLAPERLLLLLLSCPLPCARDVAMRGKVLITITLTLLAGVLRGDPLRDLRSSFDAREGALDTPIGELERSYETQLVQLRERSADDGDLDSVLEVNREIEGFRASAGDADVTHPELRRLRSIYRHALAQRIGERARARESLYGEYAKELEELVSSLTKERQFESAKAAQAELQMILIRRQACWGDMNPLAWSQDAMVGTTWVNEKGQEFTFLEGGVLRNLNVKGDLSERDRWVLVNDQMIEVRWRADPHDAHQFIRIGNGREARFMNRHTFCQQISR